MIIYLNDGWAYAERSLIVLGLILIPILIPSVFAFFARFGLIESLASDTRKGVAPGWVSLICWILFIIVSMSLVFKWSLY